MRIKTIILLYLTALLPLFALAQTPNPRVTPSAHYEKDGQEQVSSSDFDGNAPLSVTFRANPEDLEGFSPVYEWHFQKEGTETELMVRYEENTEYTFTESGVTVVTLNVRLNDGSELPASIFRVTISESILEFPNAFSPHNGDELNDTFRPKNYRSLVEFHAYIFNRWGQKLYDWTDPSAEGWDGTYNGKDVKEGVYFLLAKAKGADGRVYTIRKDVNLLRGYIEDTSNK